MTPEYAPTALQDEPYRGELLGIIQEKIDEHPRSQQIEVGPSEIGGCERALAWKLAYGGGSDEGGGWAAHKGTVLHAWLDVTFKGASRYMPDGSQRFFSDLKVKPVSPHVNGGTLDLYDNLLKTVVDWKLPGDWTMKNVRGGYLSWTYYVQLQVYGLGQSLDGYDVQRVGIMFLPMCGDDLHGKSKGAFYRYWAFDPEVAWEAIHNVERIKNLFLLAPAQRVIESMNMKPSFCSSCPAYAGSGDRRSTCPGAKNTRNPYGKLDPNDPFSKV